MGDNRRVDFEKIKADADFAAVLRHYGVEVPAGRTQLKIRCPFHDDERPSCSVNLDKRLFHCHAGGCGASGNVLDFVWRMENRAGETVSLRLAGRALAGICGIPLGNGSGMGSGRPQEARTEARSGETGKKHRPGGLLALLGLRARPRHPFRSPSGTNRSASRSRSIRRTPTCVRA